MRSSAVRVAALALVMTVLPTATANAATVLESYDVPAPGGMTIHVEVMRDGSATRPAPVVLTYSPYNAAADGNPADDPLGRRLVAKGMARAVADVPGTGRSTGCWDYGGPREIEGGAAVVRFLAARPWSSGRVGMVGQGYAGAAALGVATLGEALPELKAVASVAGPSSWHGHAFGRGVRWTGKSPDAEDASYDLRYGGGPRVPYDTPLASGVGFLRAGPDKGFNPCDLPGHLSRHYPGYSNYDAYWKDRDYRSRAKDVRAALLILQGTEDEQVKPRQGIGVWDDVPLDDPSTPARDGVLFKVLSVLPAGHLEDEWLLNAIVPSFLAVNVRNDWDSDDFRSLTYGDSKWFGDPYEGYVIHWWWAFDWDRFGLDTQPFWLQPPAQPGTVGTLTPKPPPSEAPKTAGWQAAPRTEDATLKTAATGRDPHTVLFQTPVRDKTWLLGGARLEATVRAPAGTHLSPLLVDIRKDGTLSTISRGFVNLDYRSGLDAPRPAAGQWVDVTIDFEPMDAYIAKGHRLGVVLQSDDVDWALPGAPGSTETLTDGSPKSAKLHLPIHQTSNATSAQQQQPLLVKQRHLTSRPAARTIARLSGQLRAGVLRRLRSEMRGRRAVTSDPWQSPPAPSGQ